MPLNTESSEVTKPTSKPSVSSSSLKLKSKEHWEDIVENDRPHEGDLDNSNNWSWHELGNEQCQIANAPNSSLPNLSSEDTTPNIIRTNSEAELALKEMAKNNNEENTNVDKRSSCDNLEGI
ncbi:1405_t:CDS:2 [Ambispora gerdemannii]|uniref:1405_t:CDS:1 n=1 Tax=Ambispora gerdemannii TaxID=144530 RepID=A0A9N9F413_9GLOM|nr:1405_t:CDS:2 [Ambispora gerdemannii]